MLDDEAATMTLNLPPPHGIHVDCNVAARVVLYLPTLQLWQDIAEEAPTSVLYLPFRQNSQSVATSSVVVRSASNRRGLPS